MRLRHHIKDHDKPEFTAALDKLGIRYNTKVSGGWNTFDLAVDDDDPTWPLLRDLATQYRVRVWHSPIFCNEDIISSPWLLVHATGDAGYPQPEKNFGYEAQSFNLTDFCRHCGIGKVQTQPIRLVQEPKSKMADFFAPQWLHHVLLARPAVREVFEAEKVSGVRYLAPVQDRSNLPLENVVQILPTITAPLGLVASVQEQEICRPVDKDMGIETPSMSRSVRPNGFCGRVKYHVPYKKRLVHYRRSTFGKAPDMLLSAEWFGSGSAASQLVIISNKVARLILLHKWKGLELEPIQLV